MKKKTIRGLSSLLTLLLALSICLSVLGVENEGFVNNFFNIQIDNTQRDTNAVYYKTEYTENGVPSDEGLAKLIKAEDEHNTQMQEEGAVLVLNNGALPLDKNDEKNVTLFGRSSVDPIYKCPSAGPTIDEKRVIDLPSALKNKGISVNQVLIDAYKNSTKKRETGKDIGEESIDFYTDEIRKSFSNYGDVAIVILSRLGGEGNDLARRDIDGISMLALHKQESDLLKMIKQYKDDGVFKKTIVLINSAYAMELEFVNDEQYGIDGAMWIGNPGLIGFTGVANLLVGEANPSGRFVDTYAANSLSAASTQNFGSFIAEDGKSRYVVYQEGIYIGYKYYETRYEDVILNRYNANCSEGIYATKGNEWNYADEMTYPFGYGLSYTTFEQKLDSVTWNDDNTITIKATVTNTGNVAGKSIVQVYAQVPYTEYDKEHLVEKSAIQLLDFGKTDILEPTKSETVEIVADKYLLASWDVTAHEGKGGYILDDGDYYIAIGDNAHDALNNVLAAKGATGMYDEKGNPVAGNADKVKVHNLDKFDDQTYKTSKYSGNVVENQFDTELYASDYNYFYKDAITYLTRQDWTTFPKPLQGLEINERMKQIFEGDIYEEIKPKDLPKMTDFILETPSNLKLIDMKDVEWEDDETWSKFLMQMNIAQLAVVTSDSSGQSAVESVAKPRNYQCDGPDGGSTTYKFGEGSNNTMYVNECTAACSWNKDLFEQRGKFLAEDAFYNKTSATMAPGVDIHRTPFSGRNHEYYSEDAVISYILSAVQCKAMQSRGTVTILKHFVANDQETNRSSLFTFMTEQCLREIPMKGFEGAICVGGAMSTMCGYNNIGCSPMPRNKAALTDVLRDEWGFKGFVITDANHCKETPEVSLASGTDQFCLVSDQNKEYIRIIKGGDAYILQCLLEANKRFYYTYSRSNLINGLTSDTVVAASGMPWWQTSLVVMIAVFGLATLATSALYIYLEISKKEKFEIKRNN